MGCVYVVTNKVTGKKYVGKTTYTSQIRWEHHRAISCRSNYKFHRSINKHGADAFIVNDIFTSSDEQLLNAVECLAICVLDTFGTAGYNMTIGGEGAAGTVVTETTRAKHRAAAKVRPPRSAETRRRIGDANRARPNLHEMLARARLFLPAYTDERRAKVSAALTGIKRPFKSKGPCSDTKRQKIRDKALSRTEEQRTSRMEVAPTPKNTSKFATYTSKLTVDEVLEIRRLSKDLSQRQIGRMFGVHSSAVCDIVNRKSWKHI